MHDLETSNGPGLRLRQECELPIIYIYIYICEKQLLYSQHIKTPIEKTDTRNNRNLQTKQRKRISPRIKTKPSIPAYYHCITTDQILLPHVQSKTNRKCNSFKNRCRDYLSSSCKTLWPSGLRRQIRNLFSSEASVQIRLVSNFLFAGFGS